MAFARRIRGLAKLISTMIFLCKVVDTFGPGIREFVPAGSLTTYDTALSNIKTACDLLRAINYNDVSAGTNPPWGTEPGIEG